MFEIALLLLKQIEQRCFTAKSPGMGEVKAELDGAVKNMRAAVAQHRLDKLEDIKASIERWVEKTEGELDSLVPDDGFEKAFKEEREVLDEQLAEYNITKEESYILNVDYQKVKNYKVAIGRGCEECRGTGYLGRTGIFEVMNITEKLRGEIHEKASPQNIKKVAQSQGLNVLRDNAIRKLLKGITTVDEVIRVTGLSSF